MKKKKNGESRGRMREYVGGNLSVHVTMAEKDSSLALEREFSPYFYGHLCD